VKRLLTLAVVGLALTGCQILALPIASQVPIWSAIAGGGVAVGNFSLTAYQDCRNDGGCKTPLIP
jgi:hypothetical protein